MRSTSTKSWFLAGALAFAPLALAANAGAAQTQKPSPSRGDEAQVKPEEARATAVKAAHYEKVHRERMARIRRLIAVYQQKGDEAKVAELQAMRDQLEKRHENAMQGFRRQLGEARWAQVEKHVKGPSARALEVRNERANENAAERDARKAQKEAEKAEKKQEERPKPDKHGGSGSGRQQGGSGAGRERG